MGAQEPAAPQFLDVWFGGPLDSIYNAEYQRLPSVCRGRGDDCYAIELDTTAVRLVPVLPGPGAEEPAGWIIARLRTRGEWPYAALLFQDRSGAETTLRQDLGDWGYGSTLALRRVRDGWAQLRILEPVGDFWIEIDQSSPGFGVVEGPYGLDRRLWTLGPVAAVPVSGAGAAAGVEVELPEGVYMILEVRNGTVRLRPELPQDMDCGEPEDSVALAEPSPIFEVPLTALLDPVGSPRVEPAYGKGC